jgi:hypothetical protein
MVVGEAVGQPVITQAVGLGSIITLQAEGTVQGQSGEWTLYSELNGVIIGEVKIFPQYESPDEMGIWWYLGKFTVTLTEAGGYLVSSFARAKGTGQEEQDAPMDSVGISNGGNPLQITVDFFLRPTVATAQVVNVIPGLTILLQNPP